MKALKYTGMVRDGKLPASVREAIKGLMRRMEGKKVVITIAEWQKPRSPAQNDAYWGIVVPVVIRMHRDQGEAIDKDEAHAFLQMEVLSRKVLWTDVHGVVHERYASSTGRSVEQWEEDMEIIRSWAAGFGYVIPRPGEVTELQF